MERARRERLLLAVMNDLAELGYAEGSIEEPVAASGVTMAEFEAEFGDRDTCLFAAYDYLAEHTLERVTRSWKGGQKWPARVRAGLLGLLEAVAAEPLMAKAMTRSFPAIRPAAYDRYVDLLASFEPFLTEGRRYAEVTEDLPGEVELLAVGAAEALIFAEVDAGRAKRLPEMLPEILFSVLVPFMGPDRAAEEMRDAAGGG